MLPLLRACRSLLFLPASNHRAIAKARTLDADLIILDLEDAVDPAAKEEARGAAVSAAAAGFGPRPCAIRINAAGTPWHDEDLLAVRNSSADLLVLPKAEKGSDVARALASGKPVLPMIESAAAVLAAPNIAREAAGLLLGTNDLAADLNLPTGERRDGMFVSLQLTILAARAAAVPVFDGVYNRLDDEEGLTAECREARQFGFDGKSVIHPAQIGIVNQLFSPSDEEVAAARRLVAEARRGAQRFEGRMIESLHVGQAEALLAKVRP